MGTCSHNSKSTYNLLGGLRGHISTVIIGVINTLNLQVRFLLLECAEIPGNTMQTLKSVPQP